MPGSQYPSILAGQDYTAGLIESFAPITAWKTSNTIRSATGNSNDPDLLVELAGNATYDVMCNVLFSGTGGMTWGFSPPSGATGSYGATFDEFGVGYVSIAYVWSATTSPAATAGGAVLVIEGVIFTTAASGLAFNWAANTSSDAVTVINGSKLRARRIA